MIGTLLLMLLVVNSLCVVLLQNPFFALLFLILSFLLTALMFLVLECEFFALILLIIYIGAVAILMLFVLIMLETKLKQISKNILHHFPFGFFITVVFFIQLSIIILNSFSSYKVFKAPYMVDNSFLFQYYNFDSLIDLESIGHIIYTHFVLQFIVVGLILFVSLVGVVFLTIIDGKKKKKKTFTSSSIMLSPTSRNALAQRCNNLSLVFSYIQIQELSLLPEYFVIVFLFCLTLFSLILVRNLRSTTKFCQKFPFETSLMYLVNFGLLCYFLLSLQQIDLCLLNTISFTVTIRNDIMALMAKLLICLFSSLYLIFITKYLKYKRLHNLEYYILIINSIFGFFLLCESNDLITAYLAIELQGLSFYVLTSFKKSSIFSVEAGIKYFILGSFSTALFLFGTSLIYGLTGSVVNFDFQNFFYWTLTIPALRTISPIDEQLICIESSEMKKVHNRMDANFLELLNEIKIYVLENRVEALSKNQKSSSDFRKEDWILITEITNHCPTSKAADLNQMYNKEKNYTEFFKGIELGFLLILLSLFFKLALAPFYLWAPDIYEGAPSSTTFFFLVISKFSLFVFLVRLCYSGFYGLMHYWQFYSLIVGTLSTFVGGFVGLKQRKLKSLLTYSSIGNMGFILLSFSVGGVEGIQVHFYYLLIYMISGLCIWGIYLNLRSKGKLYLKKHNKDLGDFVSINESNPIVAQNLAISFFTLAGLPPIMGFVVKMHIFKSLIGISAYLFALVNVLFGAVSTFYYLRTVKVIFFENSSVGKLYTTFNNGKTVFFIINLLSFSLIFMFIIPRLLYFYSYKMVLCLS